jgi:hypothetical protein
MQQIERVVVVFKNGSTLEGRGITERTEESWPK